MSFPRKTSIINLPAASIGGKQEIKVLDWIPASLQQTSTSLPHEVYHLDRAYIQASLHADELPGMLVLHHLIRLLDQAAAENKIVKPITLVPYANPIGLSQVMMGAHLGRFALSGGTNFNRDWIDVSRAVADSVKDQLDRNDAQHNIALIRKALLEEADKLHFNKVERVMKKELYKRSCTASLVLDLHCDSDAVMHMYTHDRLWPEMVDVAEAIGSQCNLLAPQSGGNPFDEALSGPWATLADIYPSFPIPMACHSATIELRGETNVYDDVALDDAKGLYYILAKRGYVNDDCSALSFQPRAANLQGTPLTGVDMIEAPVAGVLAWKVHPGDQVEAGQLLGEVVIVDDIDAPRVPLRARTAGIVFGMHRHKLSIPGEIVVKVAGKEVLPWRKGHLLTA
eukprot:gene2942-3210_t